LDELEAKAAKAAEYEQQSQAQQAYSQFRQGLEVFAKENGAEPDAIQEFMVNNQIGNMEVAYKAMQYEAMKQQLETAKKEGVKEFLAAKGSIPNIPGNSALGQVQSPAPKTMEEARQRALQRLQ
jgi:CRISPR/Cas system CSM-associated protein Csm5 (group 7 of RAMP superfamily)